MDQSNIDKILAVAERLVELKRRRDEMDRERQELDRQIEEAAGEFARASSIPDTEQLLESSSPEEIGPPPAGNHQVEQPEEIENRIARKIDAKTLQGRIVLFLLKAKTVLNTDMIASAIAEDRQRTLFALQALRSRTMWITKPGRGLWGLDLKALEGDMA